MRYFAAMLLVSLIVPSWLLLAVLDPKGPPIVWNYLLVGYLIGTMFGQTTLASAWTALGPLPLLWRLPLSLGWVSALSILFVVNTTIHGNGPDAQFGLILAICLAGQWLLVQCPLWVLVVLYGIRLRHVSDPPETIRDRQFGIRQVMILTAIVAVVLGACRWAAAASAQAFSNTDWNEVIILAFLAAAGIAMTLPLLVAALLPRYWWLAIAVVLALIACGTWYELPLMQIAGGRGGGPDIWHLVFINGFQSAWILAVVALVRLCGYSIQQPGTMPPAGG
jgi:hypothetical protein